MACVETSLENRINELHNDILVQILSLLTLKEAGRTSILSKRWRDLWAYVPILHFDTYPSREDALNPESDMEEEEPKYLHLVDQVMSLHKAPTIDEFRVKFNLVSNRKDIVDNWVKSASEKRVKKFQLNLASWNYTYQYHSLPSLSLFNSLTSLELAMVDVSDNVLEKVLHDCPLEHLLLFKSLLPEYLKVVGPYLKLKTFTLHGCQPRYDLEISAPNLTSFSYTGEVLDKFLLKSIPKLTEIYFGDEYAAQVIEDPLSLSSCSSQIEVLTLDICRYVWKNEHIPTAKEFPVWTKLKKLDIYIKPKYDDQLFDLLSLIKACPSLQKFVLQTEFSAGEVKRTAVTRNVESCPHHSLKIVEIVRFIGWELDVGFVECLIENAVSLEKIIIELIDYETEDEPCLEERRTRARQQAEQLRANLNLGTELEIRNESRPLTVTWVAF